MRFALLLALAACGRPGGALHTGSWYVVGGDTGGRECCFGTDVSYTGTTVDYDFLVQLNWTDVDGQMPADTDGQVGNEIGCSEDTVDLRIEDPLGVMQWDFGMSEIGSNGWTGEDCLNGLGAYAICHHTESPELQLVEVCTPDEVVESQTTLLDHSKDPFLTYFVDDGSSCFVFGNDPAYYAVLGCVVLN